jgi:hypothetical protein
MVMTGLNGFYKKLWGFLKSIKMLVEGHPELVSGSHSLGERFRNEFGMTLPVYSEAFKKTLGFY